MRIARNLVACREEMVAGQLEARGIRDPRVLQAMREVPREAFVPADLVDVAYEDNPLPIGEQQTISQPYVVALMAEALELRPTDRVLEIGTGSGYAAAVLGRLAAEVYTIERHASLASGARQVLAELGIHNVHVVHADGTLGWPPAAPFDAVVAAAGGPILPAPLVGQLARGGRLVMPVGPTPYEQSLVRVRWDLDGTLGREDLGPVRFVPLIGAAGWPDATASPAIRRRDPLPSQLALPGSPSPAAGAVRRVGALDETRGGDPLADRHVEPGEPETFPFGV